MLFRSELTAEGGRKGAGPPLARPLRKTIGKLVPGITVMRADMAEGNISDLARNKEQGRAKAGKFGVPPILPVSLGNIGGKERVGLNHNAQGGLETTIQTKAQTTAASSIQLESRT